MAAYIIVNVEITDPAHYQEYVRQVPAWWPSENYRGPKALRQSASITNKIIVEGV